MMTVGEELKWQKIIIKDDIGNKLEIYIEKYNEAIFGYSIAKQDEAKALPYFTQPEKRFDNALDAFKEAIIDLKNKNKDFSKMILDNDGALSFVDIETIKKNTSDLKLKEYRVNGVKA